MYNFVHFEILIFVHFKFIIYRAEGLYFKEYDPDWINQRLKGLDYKKTEWDKINHENYRVIEDKYRKI